MSIMPDASEENVNPNPSISDAVKSDPFQAAESLNLDLIRWKLLGRGYGDGNSSGI